MISVRFSASVAFVLEYSEKCVNCVNCVNGINRLKFHEIRTENAYNTLPPPNIDRKVVEVLVPMPSVRSTNSAVNSPYMMSITGVLNDFTIVNMMPRHNRNLSSVDAYRY